MAAKKTARTTKAPTKTAAKKAPAEKAVAKRSAPKASAAKAERSEAQKPISDVSAKTGPTTLTVGRKAPDFTLPSSDGGDVTLSAFAGKHVVVYFYPRDDTPGCTRQAQGLRDAHAELAKRGAIVLGVSKDSVESHRRFRDKHSLDFPLLSDREGTVIARWGAWGEKNMYGKKSMGIVRSTVVVAPDGTVKRVFPKVKVDDHVRDVLAAIDA